MTTDRDAAPLEGGSKALEASSSSAAAAKNDDGADVVDLTSSSSSSPLAGLSSAAALAAADGGGASSSSSRSDGGAAAPLSSAAAAACAGRGFPPTSSGAAAAAAGSSPTEAGGLELVGSLAEAERLKQQQKLNAAVATAERRSNERPGVMKRARWGATHRIHEHFVDGFPELEERFVREREAAERRFEYNLGSRNFATKREGEEGIDTLKVLFRKLDRAIGLRDATMVQSIREEFLAELRHWNWRKGARVEFKRRKMVQTSKAAEAEGLVGGDADGGGPDDDDHHHLGRGLSGGSNDHHRHMIDTSSASSSSAPPPPQQQQQQQRPHHIPPSVSVLVDAIPPKTEDDSSVDDLDADDVNCIDDRVRRVSAGASSALRTAASNNSSSTPAASSAPRGGDKAEKVHVAEARRHLLAESVAIALVTLKWRAMRPNDLQQMRDEADKRAKVLEAA